MVLKSLTSLKPFLVTWKGFPSGSLVKTLPAIEDMQVHSLSQDDPLEKRMATHCSILAWRSPWMEEPGGLWSTGSQKELDTT